MNIDVKDVVIGQYADYLDTGIWSIKDGKLIPPDDLTERQLRDFKMVFGELLESKLRRSEARLETDAY